MLDHLVELTYNSLKTLSIDFPQSFEKLTTFRKIPEIYDDLVVLLNSITPGDLE